MAKLLISAEEAEEIRSTIMDIERNQVPEMSMKVNTARAHGDASENSELESSLSEMSGLRATLIRFRTLLDTADIIDTDPNSEYIQIGDYFALTDMDGGFTKAFKMTGIGVVAANAINTVDYSQDIGSQIYNNRAGEFKIVNRKGDTRRYAFRKINLEEFNEINSSDYVGVDIYSPNTSKFFIKLRESRASST
jgi:transcription elongation GreA/GreB family factor